MIVFENEKLSVVAVMVLASLILRLRETCDEEEGRNMWQAKHV